MFRVEAGSKRRCASLRGGRLRPATLRVAKAKPSSPPIRPRARPPAPAFGVRCAPRTAIPVESRYSLLAYSNSPPAGSATSPDELQPSACRGGGLRGSKSRNCTDSFTAQVCRIRAAASGPGIEDAPPQARRFYEPQKHNQKPGPARQENRLRFSRPKNEHGPKLVPVLRLVCASLRLRFRSAAAARHPQDGRAYS